MKSHLSGFRVFGSGADSAPQRLFEVYHENSKLRPNVIPQIPRAFVLGQENPAPVQPKKYPHARSFALPPWEQADWEPTSLAQLVAKRRTHRKFESRALPMASLAALLHCAYGLSDSPHQRRHAPSAGALFPLEIYAALNYSVTPPPGLYHYGPSDHALAQLNANEPAKMLAPSFLEAADISAAPLIVVIAAVFGKTTAKYGDRGYRYILLEAGHVAQNIALAAVALGLATFPAGGFYDDKVNAWLGLDGVNEAVCYMIGIGAPVA